MTKLTDREKWALRELLDFDIRRYLMANSIQRLDGAEKADRHIKISKTLCKFVLCDDTDRMSIEVHDFLADILTDKMDEVIGFPIHTPLYGEDYDILADKFFDVIVENFDEIEKIVIIFVTK
jgi:hypothetical protein